MAESLIELYEVTKEFTRGDGVVRAVDGVSLTIPRGEFVSVVGRSGSGKTTVLYLMSSLLTATHGTLRFQGREIGGMTDRERTAFRRERIGFIFQFFNLLPTLTALENVALPLLLSGISDREANSRASQMLEIVRLADRASYRPNRLSGGELQRVAIARGLVNQPLVLFADEPTGNLDTVSAEEILALVRSIQADQGGTVVLVTHDPKAAAYGDRVITLRDGRVAEDLSTAAPALGSTAMSTRPNGKES